MHLSYHDIELLTYAQHRSSGRQSFYLRGENENTELDDLFFYSVPTSFFVLDDRIPEKLRELFTEADGSLKMNFLTGASACARKVIYELAHLNDVAGDNYSERIKNLKEKYPDIDGTYFDTLLTIQQATSSLVHENAYDGWKATHVRLILFTLREILHELYVVPKLRAERRREILDFKNEVLGDRPELEVDGKPSDDA